MAGLGYYSRARICRKQPRLSSRNTAEDFRKGTRMFLRCQASAATRQPRSSALLLGQSYAVLDGNVSRVLARLLSMSGDPKSSTVQNRLWEAAQQLLPRARPGDFNQAVMELGATVCSPRQPRCLLCPWTRQCLARQQRSAGVAAGEVSARESPQVVTGSGRGPASGTVSHCPSVGPTAVKRILGISIHGATREEERSKNGGTLRR